MSFDPSTGQAQAALTRIIIGVPLSAELQDRLHKAHPSVTFDHRADEEDRRDLGHADAFIGWQVSDEQVRDASRLRWVQLMSAGVEHLPVAALEATGIVVTNASGAHAINIGEHVMAMMLAFARQLPFLIREQDQRRWFDGSMRERVFELHGQTLVILGTGQIATALAERAAGFGMRTVGVRRRDDRPAPSGFDAVVTLDRLDEFLPVADHLAVCVPLTASTRHLLDARRLGLLKPGAHLFNIGRGAVIDQEALVAALRSGHIAGAGLDVTDPEPLPPDSPLWTMPNVLITAHSSGASPHYLGRAVAIASDNIGRWQLGERLRNIVDLDEGY